MKDKITLITRTLVTVSIILAFCSFEFDKAEGWFIAGSQPKSYDMGIDKGSGPDGKNAASIKSKDKKIKGFGTMMQNFKPDNYTGKKIHLTGMMKSKDVKERAGFWLRVDKSGSTMPLSFDNMFDRPVTGNTDWKKYEIVLDVPEGASNIAFGALLSGTGQIWFDNIQFDIADNTVPSTQKIKTEPSNLNFDK